MIAPIRVLHFADLHIGMENYGRLDAQTGTSSRVRDFLDRLDAVIDYGVGEHADLAIFAGDAFKTRDPNPTHQREFARRLKRLSDQMQVLLVVGNHDLPGMASKATTVDIFRALDVPNVIVGHMPEGRVVDTRRGPLFLAWLPYPMRNRLLRQEQHSGSSVDQLDIALRGAVADVVGDLARQAKDHDMPRVLTGHFSVAEAKLGSERTVMLGRDVAVTKSALADDVWDYVALGHIHKHQDLNKGMYPGVVYSGSLERIDFGEENEVKGFCWVELVRGETRWRFVPVNARPFITIEVDARDNNAPTSVVVSAIKRQDIVDAIVRLIVHIKSEQTAMLREADIDDVLATAYSYNVVREVEYEARTRIGGLAAETLSPVELLERYFVDKGYESNRIQRLVTESKNVFEDNTD